jgi:hypothetical protein
MPLPRNRFLVPALGVAATLVVGGGVLAVISDTVTIGDSAIDSDQITTDLIEVALAGVDITCANTNLDWQSVDSIPGSITTASLDEAVADQSFRSVIPFVDVCIRTIDAADGSIDDGPVDLEILVDDVVETELDAAPGECASEAAAGLPGPCAGAGELSPLIQVRFATSVLDPDAACHAVAGAENFVPFSSLEGSPRAATLNVSNFESCRLTMLASVIPYPGGLTDDDWLAGQTDRLQYDVALTATPG